MFRRMVDAGGRLGVVGALGAVALAACGEESETRSCTLKGCGGSSMLYFAGGSDDVTPSGELRLSGGSARTWEFDCRPETQPSNCNDGVLRLDEVWSEDTLELRFNLVDGTKSDWQAISLTFEEHTIEDFNGPDCPCTYHTVAADPIRVPADAQLSTEGNDDAGP